VSRARSVEAEGDAPRIYRVQGDRVESLSEGFDELGMPTGRRSEAIEVVREVLAANEASVLRWYKTGGTSVESSRRPLPDSVSLRRP